MSNLLGRNLPIVVQGVKPLVERLLALGTKVALASVRCFTMFVSTGMTTEPTFHQFCLGVDVPLPYLTHHNLMHYPLNLVKAIVKKHAITE